MARELKSLCMSLRNATADDDADVAPGFRQQVYAVVREIPVGRVLGYAHVAALIGRPRVPRQVGYALSAIPEGSDVPWWRVIRADGSVAMQGDPSRGPLQIALLRAEGVQVDDARVDMKKYRWNAA